DDVGPRHVHQQRGDDDAQAALQAARRLDAGLVLSSPERLLNMDTRLTLCGRVADVVTALTPIGDQLRREITPATYLQTDDTSVTVLDNLAEVARLLDNERTTSRLRCCHVRLSQVPQTRSTCPRTIHTGERRRARPSDRADSREGNQSWQGNN